MRFVLAIPYAYPRFSAMLSSQKELHLKGKDNFFLIHKIWEWKCVHMEKTESLTFIFFQSRKNQF